MENTFSIDPSILARAEEYDGADEAATEDEGSGYAERTRAVVKRSVAKAVSTAKQSTKRTNTKSIRAMEIYKQFAGDRALIIGAFMSELNMSRAGATTYFYNAKKVA